MTMAAHPLKNNKKLKSLTSAQKIMTIMSWDRKGPILVVPRWHTINSPAYCKMLKKLHQAIQNKWQGMLTWKICLFHNNTRPHTAHGTQELLQSFKFWCIHHTVQILHQVTFTCFLSRLNILVERRGSRSGDNMIDSTGGRFYDARIYLIPRLNIHGDYVQK